MFLLFYFCHAVLFGPSLLLHFLVIYREQVHVQRRLDAILSEECDILGRGNYVYIVKYCLYDVKLRV